MKASRNLGIAAASLALAIACDQSQAAPEPAKTGEASPSPAAEGPKVEGPNFMAEMKASGALTAGKAGTVQVVLEPKGGYKINDKYPTKLSLKETDGLTFEKAVLRKEDGEFTEKKGTFKVSVTPRSAGKATVAGKLSMSVCSEENCVMEKVELALDVDVQ